MMLRIMQSVRSLRRESRPIAPTFLSQWRLVTLTAALTLTAVDALLLQRSRALFTGGFLSVDHLDTGGLVTAFVVASLIVDAAVAGLFAAATMVVLASFQVRRAAVLAGALMAALGPLLFANVLGYQLVRYLGTAVDLALMFDLTGRSVAEMVAVSSAHAVAPTLAGMASAAMGIGIVWGLNRRSGPLSQRPPLSVLTVPVGAAVLAVATLLVAVWGSEALENGLLRKPSGRLLSAVINLASDVDRDGYGLIGSFRDPDPFDSAISPYAPDIPDNGVDEDGIGGDLRSDAPRYDERPVASSGWRQRPDVVFVVLESFRADLLGASHGGRSITPVLNALAATGVSSAQAYSHNGYTVHSRYHMFAGDFTSRLGASTLIDDFRGNGYVVGYFSGQDESFGADVYGVGFERADVSYDARSDRTRRYSTHATPGSLAIPYQAVLENVEGFVASRGSDGPPIFVYVNFEDMHFPYAHEGIESILSTTRVPRARISPETRDELWATYVNTAANVDRAVGRLIEHIGQVRGVAPAVVVTADHGESLFDEGFLGHGYGLNDVQTRVPFIVAGLPVRVEEPFSQVDIRSALTQALTLGPDSGATATRVSSDRPVLQYLGDLRRPRQIAFLREGRRFIYDFRADRVQTWDGVWRTRADLSSVELPVFERLIQHWEWINLSLRRDTASDGE
jgi:hypothetical protein